MMRVRSILGPVLFGAVVCAGVSVVCVPAAPPQNVVFDKVREGDHTTLANALRADAHVAEWRDSLGYTLLHWAAAVDDDGAVRMLLDAGADPNARDIRGQTPLHVAAMSQIRSGDVLIKTLLARGAHADSSDARGVTPLQLARSVERADLAQALLAAGATEIAKAADVPQVKDVPDTRVASAVPTPRHPAASDDDSTLKLRPRRPRPLGPLGVWARLNGVRPRPPVTRSDG
jgi:ankyrin repeat protein